LDGLDAWQGFQEVEKDGQNHAQPECQNAENKRRCVRGQQTDRDGTRKPSHGDHDETTKEDYHLSCLSGRQLPGYAVKVAEQVEKHGIDGLAYESSEMKKAGRDLGMDIGSGIRHFAIALSKDMVAAVASARQYN